MVLMQLAFLSQAQALLVGPSSQDLGCTNVRTELVFCTLTKQDAYWLLEEDKRLFAGEKEEFDCDHIPHYYIEGKKAIFACSEGGVLQKTECPCLTVGRQQKTNQVSFGVFEPRDDSSNDWLDVSYKGLADKISSDDPDVEVYEATVKESPNLKFYFKMSEKTKDSIIYNVTPEQCMQICLYHNKWAQENAPEKGCSVAAPRTLLKSQVDDYYFPEHFLTEDDDESTCWLRYTESEELANIVDDETKTPFSYDLTCTVDELTDVPTVLQGPTETPEYR